jgi:cytochrome c oxidase assembly factor CtaG
MNTLLTSWQWSAGSLALLLLICGAYGWLWKARWGEKAGIFCAALLLMVLCLFSPLAVLSEHYLFSAHMAVHVVLLLLVGPLLVLSLPPFRTRTTQVLLAKPWLGWVAGIGTMWFWHLPFVFHRMMTHGSGLPLHRLETLSLIVAGMVFSYPVLGASRKMHPLGGVLYLGAACLCCSLLGLLITFAPAGLYHHYLAMHDGYGLNRLIQNGWGLSEETDQQAAGLIMWVPCCMIYLAGALLLLKQWFEENELRSAIESFTKKSTL